MVSSSIIKGALISLTLLVSTAVSGQDLMDLLEDETPEGKSFAIATFKGTRVVLGQSVKTRKKKELEVLIMHRFGTVENGFKDAYGLDEANIRISFEYGITDNFNIGLGRSSVLRTYDGFLKYKFLRQSSPGSPVTIVAFASFARNTNEAPPDVNLDFNHRMAYTTQILIARKFSEAFSLQLTPSIVHKNLVTYNDDDNTQYSLGIGGRLRLSPSVTFNAEYFHQFYPNRFQSSASTRSIYRNPISIGFDIETGGHVFQLHFTNANAMIEKSFIHETTGDVEESEIRFGFNLSRTFQLPSKPGK